MEILESELTNLQQANFKQKQSIKRLEQDCANFRTQLEADLKLIRRKSEYKEHVQTLQKQLKQQQQDMWRQPQQQAQQFQQVFNQISQTVVRGDVLGKGAWSTVFKGTIAVAVKELYNVTAQRCRLFQHEVKISSLCHHPNIVQFFGALNDPRGPSIYLELMDRNLREFIQDHHPLKHNQIVCLSLDIAQGLCCLHHSDLKTDNILLRKQGSFWIAKIGDLGTAVFQSGNLPRNRGSLKYAAPEARTTDRTVNKR